MHALHLPPRHVWSTGLLALLLVVAMLIVLTTVSGVELPAIGGEPATAPVSSTDAPSSSAAPAWVVHPLRPPTVELSR
jgi:hypothetical protein